MLTPSSLMSVKAITYKTRGENNETMGIGDGGIQTEETTHSPSIVKSLPFVFLLFFPSHSSFLFFNG